MDIWMVRSLALGAALVLLARPLAHWWEWEPWTVRIVGLASMVLGIVLMALALGGASVLRALAGIVPLTAIYLWQDVRFERADDLRQAAEEEKLLDDLDRDDPRRPPRYDR